MAEHDKPIGATKDGAPVYGAPKKRRGFAAMTPEQRAVISSKGGKAAHAAGTAHEFSSELARQAGAKGGRAVHAKRKAAKEAPSMHGVEEET